MRFVSRRIRHANVRRAPFAGAVALVCASLGFLMIAELPARPNPAQSAPAPSQAQISAAFIFNFAKFTEWPPQAFADAGSPMTVCFLGAEDVRGAYQNISAGKTVNGRPVLVREVKPTGDVHDCHIVYMDSPNLSLFAGVLKNTRQCNALVVGTAEGFLERGGMIKLLVENNRMRFDVNMGAVGRTKIKLSSKLLALARSVVDLPDPAGN
jgi:YfiR/HmsC-like